MPGPSRRARVAIAVACAAVAVAAGALAGSAPAQTQSLQQQLSETEAKLSAADKREGVLTTEISAASEQISTLQTQVADLRNREATLQAELEQKQAELREAQTRLEELRDRLSRAIDILEARLVAIYKSGEPDLLSVVLEADGFDDLLERTEYLQRLEDQDSSIVGRVRELRDEMRVTVTTVKAARDSIAERKQELERIRADLEQRSAELAAAREQQQAALSDVRDQQKQLEGDLSDISAEIEEQLGLAGRRDAAGRPDPGRPERLHLARQRARHLRLRHALGPDARGHRHRGPLGHADPRREVGDDRARVGLRRLRELHLHQPRRRALHLLRAPVPLRAHVRLDQPGLDPGLRRLHRALLRRSPPL